MVRRIALLLIVLIFIEETLPIEAQPAGAVEPCVQGGTRTVGETSL
jgi:hypothetical protein